MISRRHALGLGAATLTALAMPASATEPDSFAAAVDAGLDTFRRRARDQAPLARALTVALGSSDRAAAEAAYIAARPPYEEIEVLALCFPETDEAIDARPYAFDGGETDPGFKGFHKVEALLFRDGDLRAALPHAEELERYVAQLARDLERREAFSAAKSFEGMIALATEIPAKKISSEEETWSDRSLLIFRHNLLGIQAQAEPFREPLAERDPAAATALQASLRAARAAVDAVYGTEPGGTRYSRVGVAERRAISDAAYRTRDALDKAADVLGLAS